MSERLGVSRLDLIVILGRRSRSGLLGDEAGPLPRKALLIALACLHQQPALQGPKLAFCQHPTEVGVPACEEP